MAMAALRLAANSPNYILRQVPYTVPVILRRVQYNPTRRRYAYTKYHCIIRAGITHVDVACHCSTSALYMATPTVQPIMVYSWQYPRFFVLFFFPIPFIVFALLFVSPS